MGSCHSSGMREKQRYTHAGRRLRPHAYPRRWRQSPSALPGKCACKRKGPLSLGFSWPPLSPWQPVLTGKRGLIYEGCVRGIEAQRSRARTGCASSPGQKQESERLKTQIKSPLKITEQTLAGRTEVFLLHRRSNIDNMCLPDKMRELQPDRGE